MEIPKNIYFKLRRLILPIDEILTLIPKNAEILDLGCGKGIILKYIKYFKSYTGVDLNITKIDKNMENIKFIKDDSVIFINRKLESYNTFLLIDLLHHIEPSLQLYFVKKLINSMKSGDILIIKDIFPKSFLTRFWNSFHDFIISRQLINYFDFDALEKIMSKNTIILNRFHKRIFLYDHFFLVIKRN